MAGPTLAVQSGRQRAHRARQPDCRATNTSILPDGHPANIRAACPLIAFRPDEIAPVCLRARCTVVRPRAHAGPEPSSRMTPRMKA
jgi:hypothetical protein